MTRNKRLTVNQLHKRLSDLIMSGKGKLPVCVNKDTFQHACEDDGVVILDVYGCESKWIRMADDDGGTKTTKAGLEVTRQVVVLSGDAT